MKKRPLVSIVIPTYNEENYIARCLQSLLKQTYPAACYELVVVDGCSTDRTVEVVEEKAAGCPVEVRLLSNERRVTPVALNMGIKEARGEVVIILSGHAYVAEDFIEKCVEYLDRTGASCVGGPLETVGEGFMARYISQALSSPFGVGNARFRFSKRAQPVDTVAYGAYRREVFEKIGLFDERLIRNQDIEFNYRLRRQGGLIYMTPEIRSYYVSRRDLISFVKQSFGNGMWNVYTWFLHRNSLSWRHFVPAAFVASLLLGLVLLPGFPWLLWFVAGSYISAALVSSLIIAFREKDWLSFFVLPWIFACLHLSYGAGTLYGLLRLMFWKGKD
ncbi:glycosyltransferase family 2 protein [Calderihabitans maritimus]|uniref:Glycosyl transferase family protein n=1 Tax=Calderihabitans maritimus TaxID=1246530 RepID=A0A1Z5HWU0_9FIRM|nr:glycosyltransferase family 2 protein [Calderihabitans maritimus]GAW94003.1 glycosyl transferase family protein [Calderihabitans maritimus]